jgi:hypothetical protein
MRFPVNRTFSRAGSYPRYSSDCPAQRGRGVRPYGGRATTVCCFRLTLNTMISHDPCPTKAVRT